MNLRLKFTLIIFTLLTFSILGISFGVFLTQKSLLKEQFEDNQQKLFKDFSFTCQEAVKTKDEILIFNTIKSLVETYKPLIVYAGYTSTRNTTFLVVRDKNKEYEFINRIFLERGYKTAKVISSEKEEILEFTSELRDTDSGFLATIKVGFSQTYLKTQINNAVGLLSKRILSIAIVAVLFSLGLTNLLTFYLVKPINILTKAANEVASGNLETKTEIKRNDEIGILSKTFDEMVEKLKQLDELKDSFVSSVSHELRSPLSAIDGYVEYLIEGLEKQTLTVEKQQKALKIIKDSVIRLTTFINNILDLAKIKAGRFEIHKSSINVHDVISEVISLFEQLASQQQKVLKREIESSIPNIYGDAERIKQVLINLIGNAFKFTEPNATITITARLVKEDVLYKGYKLPIENASGNFVEISVIDTGCGIPENEIDKIFDKFYQVGGTTPRKPKGTGLGLSIAAEIVKLHNGEIGVESELEKGSKFKFVIPTAK